MHASVYRSRRITRRATRSTSSMLIAAMLVDRKVPGEEAPRAPELGVAGRRLEHARELREQALACGVELLGRGRDVDAEGAGREALRARRRDAVGEAPAVAQLEEEAPALAGEQLRDHLEGEAVVVAHREAAEAD